MKNILSVDDITPDVPLLEDRSQTYTGGTMRKMQTIPHLITIRYVRNGFSAKCSCGTKLSNARGCNRSGMGYAKVRLWATYVAHCETMGVEPTMHHDLHHLVMD